MVKKLKSRGSSEAGADEKQANDLEIATFRREVSL